MAAVFRIEDYDASDTLNLLDSSGVTLASDGGWSIYIQTDETETTDTYRLIVTGSTKAAIRTNVNSLVSKLNDAKQRVREATNHRTYWLRMASDGETAKRALITNFEFELRANQFQSPLLEQNEAGVGVEVFVAITRLVWEDISDTALPTSGTTDTWVKTFDMTSVSGGHQSARVVDFTLEGDTANIARYWVGIKPELSGQDFSSINFHWQPSDNAGTIIDTDDTTDETTYYETDFSTSEDVVPRAGSPIVNFAGSTSPTAWQNLAGRFRVLLVYAVTTTTTEIDARLGFGANSDEAELLDFVNLPATDGGNDVIEMGEISIPNLQLGSYEADISNYNYNTPDIFISAGRYSGSGVFRLRALILIPAEHFFKIDLEGNNINSPSTGSGAILVTTTANDNANLRMVNKISGLDYEYSRGNSELSNWSYPKEGGVMVIHSAFAAAATSTFQSDVTVSGNIRKRWLGYHD